MSLGAISAAFDPACFRCRDGTPIPQPALDNLRQVHAALWSLLAWVRDPHGGNRSDATLEVLSGWRSPAYNKKVGGAKNSEHVRGRAADIVIPGAEPAKVQAWVDLLQRDGRLPKGGLGRYRTFTHIDVRGNLARWVG